MEAAADAPRGGHVDPGAGAPAAGPEEQRTTRYGYVVAVSLAVVYTFNFLDRQFLSVLAQPVKTDLHLSDTELGALTGLMFALFYTFCGIPIAAWADRGHRVRIITLAASTWSLFTALSGFAGNFAALAAARVGVGVGEAGGSPPSYSILSDYFPPEKRGTAFAVYSLGVPFGAMFGTMAGGLLAAAFGWRATFWMLGALGLVLTPLIPLVVKEPRRGAFDRKPDPAVEAHEPAPGMFGSIGLFLRSPPLLLTGISAGLTSFCGYAVLIWAPSLLMREKHASLTDVGTWYAVIAGLSMAAGTYLSGRIVDRWGPRRPEAYALVPGVCMLLSAPFLWGAVQAPSWPIAMALLAGPGLFNNAYLAPALAVVQNGVPARSRGTAGALLLFMLNLIGLGGGPLFVGVVSDLLKPRYGAHALPHALLWLLPFFGLAFLGQLAAAAALRRRRPA